jgi:hypothetical protein
MRRGSLSNPFPKYPLALIVWRDSASRSSFIWRSIELLQRDRSETLCISVGWIIHTTKDFIVIAPHLSPDSDDVSGEMTIPIRSIKSKRILAK